MSMEFDYWTSKAREEVARFDDEKSTDSAAFETEIPESNELQTDASGIPLPIQTNNEPVEYNDILNENQNNEIVVGSRGKRICKAVFLGVPFGIPLFIIMLVLLSACVAAVSIVFGIMVMACTLLVLGGLGLVLLGISNVHLALAPSLWLMGCGILAIGLGLFLVLLTRLVFKYVLLGLFKLYVLPVRFIQLFFGKKTVRINDMTPEYGLPGEDTEEKENTAVIENASAGE